MVKNELFLERAYFENFENSRIEVVFMSFLLWHFQKLMSGVHRIMCYDPNAHVNEHGTRFKCNSDPKLYKNEWKTNGFCGSLQKWCWLLAQRSIRASISRQQRGMIHTVWIILHDEWLIFDDSQNHSVKIIRMYGPVSWK